MRDTRTWLGLDVGGTKILGALVAEDGRCLAVEKVPSGRDEGREGVLARCLALARELAREGPRPQAAGVGFAGLVDHARGRVLSSIILPGWDGFPLAERLARELGIPTSVENDATAAGIGEYAMLGSPPDANLAVFTVGTGIGGALFVGGRLHRGATGTSAEFGNMTIDWQGDRCWCGNRGCLNTLASGTAIVRRAVELARESGEHELARARGLEDVARAAARGSLAAARAIEAGARALGAGIANVVNVFNPDRVSLCGGVIELGEAYLALVRDEAGRRAFAEPFAHAVIAPALLGEKSGAFGAAWLARQDAEALASARRSGT